ncbi:cutinase transcription factor 1 alpha [Paraphaeosphaeria sporulosa]|uniref:Cutinase transcription factor 1 alpha n=1 Tax=Paraphaeosphaeria sporulosa TaxID=1460663 RepID=A0A177CZ74_9PLEO|nr:cutinase transcription factor 1 alpha [Paraphaeosphaeria sporulosa]OAG12835.1 cutinase transcription factor 1 alpha [Paraphaeosphaeria sporulosa]
MSESSNSPPSQHEFQAPKRKAAQAGIDGHATGRSVKRRASKACQCCRARKVRCNVTEHGAPCTNCRLDEVECIVSESRRKKKWSKDDEHQTESTNVSTAAASRKLASRDTLDSVQPLTSAGTRRSLDAEAWHDEHVPHSIYQSHGNRLGLADLHRRMSVNSQTNGMPILPYSAFGGDSQRAVFGYTAPKLGVADLPLFIKPLPSKIGPDEVAYLEKKGALTIPTGTLRSEMLRAYIEFVHPYMPLLELRDFLMTIDQADGSLGKVSLILFQAVMFAGSAFIDMHYLRAAGYATRKEARKDFFQKTRILYDFDYESDRVSLVQALLLLTYYYETPDDQKDTWHWMGVATSVAHTIGLHRNPDKTHMDSKRTKLWKRIWWSTYMRDRLIALGMRRPTRIKSEDFDVPMLTLDDFEISAIPDSVTCVPADCRAARDVGLQRQLAIMCIEKARLCLCISHVLSKQYCVLNNNQGLQNDRTTMMLLPKKLDPETSEVKACDEELQNWVKDLAEEAKYSDDFTGENSLDVNRALLHMVFFTTLSALHRPQVLPSSHGGPASVPVKANVASDLLDVSRRNVRRAASAITSIAQRLDQADLVKYLPTTGVTVLLPAIIIHLLDIKAPEEDTRHASLRGFCQCMAVMGKLRDLYAAADYSTAFLEAAIRKAGIHIAPTTVQTPGVDNATSPLGLKTSPVTSVEDLVNAGRRLDMQAVSNPAITASQQLQRSTLTPPPDNGTTNLLMLEKSAAQNNVTDEEVARRLETFLASTPPESDHDHDQIPAITIAEDPAPTAAPAEATPFNKWSLMDLPPNPFNNNINHHQDNEMLFSSLPISHDFEDGEFDSLLNLDAVGETFTFDDTMLEGVDWMETTTGQIEETTAKA